MNKEQIKSAVRWVGTTFGSFIAGYFAAKGWIDADTVMGMLNSEVFVSLVTSLVLGGWGLWEKRRMGLIKAAAQVPEVKKIEVADARLARELNPQVPATVTTPEPVSR